MATVTTSTKREGKGNKNHKGIHAKTKASKLKSSKNYVKRYRGQGR